MASRTWLAATTGLAATRGGHYTVESTDWQRQGSHYITSTIGLVATRGGRYGHCAGTAFGSATTGFPRESDPVTTGRIWGESHPDGAASRCARRLAACAAERSRTRR